MKPLSRGLVFVLVSLVLTACKTAPKEAEFDKDGKKIEYVYYTPTGSILPIKVRKDQLPLTEDEKRAQKEEFSKAVDHGRKTGPLNP